MKQVKEIAMIATDEQIAAFLEIVKSRTGKK